MESRLVWGQELSGFDSPLPDFFGNTDFVPKNFFSLLHNGMEKKLCKYCQAEYPIECFEIANVINGKEYRRHKCKTCYIEAKQQRRLKMRAWFEEFKKTLQCHLCGEPDFRVLEFHHKDRNTKESDISSWVSSGRRSRENILKEVKKCKVLCANCHRRWHYDERNGLECV